MNARQLGLAGAVAIVAATAGLAAFNAQAQNAFPVEPSLQSSPSQPAYTPQPTAPSKNAEAFKAMRVTCETDVPAGKANGDVCVEAIAFLFSADIPDQFREMSEDQRIRIALRLLERGVDSSNLARARAYDYYNKVGFLGMSPYSDPFRAAELMDMMQKSGYAGATLRKIRGSTSIVSITALSTTELERRDACATAKRMLSEGKLDVDSTAIARDVVSSSICVGYEQAPK
ncbi:MAG: hypothetical protein ABIS45_01225 [Burkholderiales bacterium]